MLYHGSIIKIHLPLPSRNKQRSAPVSPLPPDTPRSKAQQILGNGALNIDGGSNWDGVSNSGISIAVSESTVRSHHPTEKTLSAITEVPAKGASQWEADSETVPAYLKVGGSRPGTGTRSHNGIDTYDPSDYSGLRARRQSASTIMSYYDKSRVPLSISQQTSSSAMAKGLPTKASTLLDIDGTMSPPKQKKRPSRLDFSYLLPRGRPDVSLRRFQEVDQEKLQEFASRASRKQIVPESPVIPNHMANSADLHNLYEHYEQMSFRQVMGPDFDMEAATGLEVVKESPAENPVQAIPQPPSPTSEPQFDPTKVLSPSRVAIMPDADYATSVSSRHTRTSKASKRTTQSIFDSDLHQNSILSLSSDSEDDAYLDQRSQRDTAIERGRGLFREEGYLTPLSEKRRSVASKSSAGSGKRASLPPRAPI
ncbi:unnamed protein product [Parascedosporium putredinis]|uniref:Uncharacterized protein n=1 Tax=Parascedosporium putredinis TaxID=1442378 RepID=A0A9P1H8K3_9PEZI|nr:unnamed protein product [Parascedosporium putredinis]CAI7999881.1 unnamed protein product [Parascedosporium putredinis]